MKVAKKDTLDNPFSFWEALPLLGSTVSQRIFLLIHHHSETPLPVIQFARLSGFHPILTTSSLAHSDYLKSLGATEVFDRSLSAPSLHRRIQDALSSRARDFRSGGDRHKSAVTAEGGILALRYAFDAVGNGDTSSIALNALVSGGTLISVGGALSMLLKLERWNKTVVNVYGTLHAPQNRVFGVELMKAFEQSLTIGEFKPNRVEILQNGLRGIEGGLNRLARGQVSGVKLVARPQETSM